MADHEVIVLLHIAEANGLYNRNEHVVITASLGGITLESDTLQPGQTTVFDINLVWETDKKVIKRMKTENLPIKLECFSVSGSSSRRQLIGFVMIPIRGVPMISGSKASKCVPRWHKLMGLAPDWKSLKPSISMYSSIMDPGQATAATTLQRDSKSLESIHTSNMLCSQQGLFVQLLPDDHCIQLGNGPEDVTMFVVHIELRSLKGLRLSSGAGDNDQFHIQYILFGSPSEDRLLEPTADGQYSIQEKINIQFRASVATLRDYFHKLFYIPVEVYRNNSAIGYIRFGVRIPPVHDMTHPRGKIYQVFDRCSFANEPRAETSLFADADVYPWIEYEFALKLLHPQPQPSQKNSPERPAAPPAEPIELNTDTEPQPIVDIGGAGDQPASTRRHNESKTRLDRIAEDLDSYRDAPLTSGATPQHSALSIGSPLPDKPTPPKTFSYQLTLQQVRFTRKVEPGIWQVSLHHPKAHTPVTLLNISVRDTSGAAAFNNVTIELLFSFAPAGIHAVIESEPCVLNIKGPHAMFATAELDNGTLLAQQRTAGIVLMENEAAEKIAIAHAFVELTDLGANLNAQQPKFRRFATLSGGDGATTLTRPHLDEELAYKMVEELEDWKSQQQDAFLVELKRREINHLARLTAEWTRRRTELEQSLAQKLEQCGALTAALEVANKNVRDKQLEDMDRQRLYAQAKCGLEKSCARKLLQLQEQARRSEDDAVYEVKVADLRHKELQLKCDQLELELRQCRVLMAEMGDELERSARDRTVETAPRTGHVDRLLDEMHEMNDQQASKHFYKEQWSRAVNEIETLRRPYAPDEGIANTDTTDETSELSLTELIVSEKAHLMEEQDELQAITQTLEQS